MVYMYFRFPDFKRKALTFSYDDGVVQDKKLIEILNQYDLKGTFNLNSGTFTQENKCKEQEIASVYQEHEVAVHTLTHPRLETLSKIEMIREILEDRKNLEALTNTIVEGMAYPFGLQDTNDEPETVSKCGICYARTVASTKRFSLPRDFMRWNPTCHHADEKIWELTEEFLKQESAVGNWRDIPKLFYIWGHSYEFDYAKERNSWEHIEKLCETLSGQDDVWYATNGEIQKYVSAFYQLQKNYEGTLVYNPSGIKLYVFANGKEFVLEPGSYTGLL